MHGASTFQMLHELVILSSSQGTVRLADSKMTCKSALPSHKTQGQPQMARATLSPDLSHVTGFSQTAPHSRTDLLTSSCLLLEEAGSSQLEHSCPHTHTGVHRCKRAHAGKPKSTMTLSTAQVGMGTIPVAIPMVNQDVIP